MFVQDSLPFSFAKIVNATTPYDGTVIAAAHILKPFRRYCIVRPSPCFPSVRKNGQLMHKFPSTDMYSGVQCIEVHRRRGDGKHLRLSDDHKGWVWVLGAVRGKVM